MLPMRGSCTTKEAIVEGAINFYVSLKKNFREVIHNDGRTRSNPLPMKQKKRRCAGRQGSDDKREELDARTKRR